MTRPHSRSTTRRRFLQAAAATAAAPLFVPRSAFGANDRVNLGAIGVGGRGFGNCMRGIATHPDVRFVAVADCFKSRRDRFAEAINKKSGAGTCTAYLDYKELLARSDVDGVVVSTPDHWHVPIAYHAALAKKDMYVEKPLGVAMAWAVRLRQVIQRNQLIFQYGTQQRSMKPTHVAMDLLRNGYIGKIKHVDVWSPHLGNPSGGSTEPIDPPDDLDYDRWLGPAPKKPYTKDRCRSVGSWHIYDYALGFIAGWGAHPLDLLQWGLDADHTSPVKYRGTGKIASGGLFDTIYTWDVRCEYENGITVRFMSSDVAEPVVKKYNPNYFKADGTCFFGEEGWVSVSRNACYLNLKGKMVNTTTFQFRSSDSHVYSGTQHGHNFVDCMKSRKPTVNPFESAIRSDTISHMSDIAIRTNSEIHWDPKTETITRGPAAAKAMLNRPQRQPWVM